MTKDQLKQRALALGFDVAGICAAVPSAQAEFYARWVEAGYAGEMSYLVRRVEERRDPRTLLPGCRSILVVGLNSFWPDEGPLLPGHGLIARYARGEDYHEVMMRRLLALREWLAAETGQPPELLGRACVDTAPLLERELAMRAGLGWIGKNCCLIHPRFGSWLLLGELLLTIELPPDEPWTAPRCGTCTRCLDACPTGALLEPYLLDARRCLAYLTIELKGAIPEELRPALGRRIFGCDLCQEVCPWNLRFGQPAGDPALQPRPGLRQPSLLELMALDEEGFRRRFRGSPIERARRRGLLRNVAVALGNWGDPAALPALSKALGDPEPLLRQHAAWALERMGAKVEIQTQ
ncbi:MAG: tRNA epoxyqueuosine(34) reductase QueG [Anaerolineae bacterium]|nr:tRNA epoxyqueuosine(34) reductase QueG [Anaerolineae bacterium]